MQKYLRISGVVTVSPKTFHPITFHPILGKITFHPIHVSPNTTFHPNYVSPKLCFTQTTLIKEFHPIFLNFLKHPLPMSYDFRSQLDNPWTDLPQILIGKNKRIVGMFLDWLKKSNLSGSTHIYLSLIHI